MGKKLLASLLVIVLLIMNSGILSCAEEMEMEEQWKEETDLKETEAETSLPSDDQ